MPTSRRLRETLAVFLRWTRHAKGGWESTARQRCSDRQTLTTSKLFVNETLIMKAFVYGFSGANLFPGQKTPIGMQSVRLNGTAENLPCKFGKSRLFSLPPLKEYIEARSPSGAGGFL
jgi:hypothetical protein